MTDLEKRADEYAIKVAEKNVMPKDGFAEHLIRQAYLDATKAETALLSQHILDLQKDKGNLTNRVRELEQQIEKMKCCENCQHWEGREPIPSLAEEGYYCFNDYPFECKRWELAEELKEIKEE